MEGEQEAPLGQAENGQPEQQLPTVTMVLPSLETELKEPLANGLGHDTEMEVSTNMDGDKNDLMNAKKIDRRLKPQFKYDEPDEDPEANPLLDTKERRLEYLLQKSEYFSHCLSLGKDAAASGERPRGRPPKNRENAVDDSIPNHRKRQTKTEEEEDKELLKLNEANSDDSNDADNNEFGVVPKGAVMFTENPWYIKNGTMRDYQIRGLNWMINLYENGINGILADEMGLGKTLQTISMIGYLKHIRKVRCHSLIVVPKSTLANWTNEFAKWCPSIRTVCLIGDPETRNNIIERQLVNLSIWDVLVTSYEMILKEKSVLKRVKWEYLIIDEAHRIKNEKSKLSEYIREFESKNRMLLTGTPLQNNLHELWALLNFLLPDVFNSAENFDDWFDTTTCLGDNTLVQRLHSVLRPFLLRRIKSEVEKSLPPKKEMKIYVPLSRMQRVWYKKMLMKDFDVLNGVGKLERIRLLNILMQLRKCSNHPYLFEGAEPGPPYTTDLHLVSNSGKLMILDKLLPKLQAEGSRVLLFSQMTRMLDILEDYALWRKIKYYRLDGQTDHSSRQRMIDEYNSPGSRTFLFMLSTRAGGLGINLYTADVVILYDSDWNPQMDLQAMDRAHRIGQKKEVRVFRLVTENTIEEKIVERAAVKLKLDKLVIQQGRFVDSNQQIKKEDMLDWIRFGANFVLSGDKEESIPDETIEAILERSKSKEGEVDGRIASMDESNLRNFVIDSNSSLYNFEGEDYRGKHKPLVSVSEWIEPPKRERKAGIYTEAFQSDIRDKDAEFKIRVPKPPKLPVLHDYQFFPPRLHEIIQKEIYYYQKTLNWKVPRDPDDDSKEAKKQQRLEQKKVDNAKPLTEEELVEREELLSQGYTTWTRRDFNQLVKLIERHGRDNKAAIIADYEGKSAEDVDEYLEVFLSRKSELKNADKIMAQIEKGENKLKRQELVRKILSQRIAKCRAPLFQLQLPHPSKASKANYTILNDRFLLSTWFNLGLDNPDAFNIIRRLIAEHSEFRFDWHFKSRNTKEIKKRCLTLLAALEKDISEEVEVYCQIKNDRKRQRDESPSCHDDSQKKREDSFYENGNSDTPGTYRTKSKRARL